MNATKGWKSALWAGIVLGWGLVGLGCREADSPAVEGGRPGRNAAAKTWVCPMHPQIVQDHPGECPLCGMDLVERDGNAHADSRTDSVAMDGPEVAVDPTVLQRIGVRTALVEVGGVGRDLRVDAEGVPDPTAEVSLTVRAMGYLEQVAPLRPGDRVRAGQVLARLYAPDLVVAQGDWLSARRTGDSLALQGARDRLEALGFPASAFAVLARSGKAERAIPLEAPVTGWIKVRSAVRGQAAMAGTELFRLVEGGGALLEARLPQADAARLRGTEVAEVVGPGSGAFRARVADILPELEAATRSVVVRLLPERGAVVRPGALYSVLLPTEVSTGPVVPSDAILHSGTRDVVFLALGCGRFRPVAVTVGPSSGGRTRVLSGLELGDEVVVSAQFLLDGESRLQAALDQFQAGAEAAGAP